MKNEGERSKALVIRLGLMANKLTFYRHEIPSVVVAELHDLQKSMLSDDNLRVHAPFYFGVISLLIDYCSAFNSGQKAKAAELQAKAEALWNKIDAAIMAVTTDNDLII